MYTLGEYKRLTPVMDRDEAFTRRQEAPSTYVFNREVYVWQPGALRDHKKFLQPGTPMYPMQEELAVDIDSEVDVFFSESIIDT